MMLIQFSAFFKCQRNSLAGGLFMICGLAQAQEVSYRGFAELETSRYPVFASNPGQAAQDRALKIQLSAAYKANSAVSFAARGFLRRDAANDNRDASRIDELWAQYATPEWDLRIGNQLVNWSSVESVSSLDIINPRDFEEDLVEPIKIGVPAVRLRKRLDKGDVTLYWLPWYQPSHYVGPRSFYSASGGLPVVLPEAGRHDGQFAMRYFRNGDGIDYGISYFRGLERNAILEPNANASALTGRAIRSQRLGLDTTKVLGELVLKGEFVYRTTDEPGNRRALLYVLGSEYTISPVWQNSDLTLIAEYLGASRNVRNIEQNQNDLFLVARWSINDRYKQQVRIGASWDLDHRQGHAWRVDYNFSPLDNLDTGIRYTYSRDYFPGPRRAERKDGVAHLFLRYNF